MCVEIISYTAGKILILVYLIRTRNIKKGNLLRRTVTSFICGNMGLRRVRVCLFKVQVSLILYFREETLVVA